MKRSCKSLSRSARRPSALLGCTLSALIVAGLLGGCSTSTSPPPDDLGSPCVPSDEADPTFGGFNLNQEYIESGSPGCASGICLVNHFQGRVTCSLGQAAPVACEGPGSGYCGNGEECVASETLAGTCGENSECPSDFICDFESGRCTRFVCAGSCGDEACCTTYNVPVAGPVCGQCKERSAADTVYCSCRCGVAEGEPMDPDFPFCECAAGFECAEVRKNLGLGDERLTGKYCIKQGTQFDGSQSCGAVEGYFDSTMCQGISF
jgi:hypothetical protein